MGSVSLLSRSSVEAIEVLQVLGPPRGGLEVLPGGHRDHERSGVIRQDPSLLGQRSKVVIAVRGAVGAEDDVQRTEPRDQVQCVLGGPILHRPAGKPGPRLLRRQQACIEVIEHVSQASEVRRVPVRRHVDVHSGWDGQVMDQGGHAADHHIAHAVGVEHPDDAGDVEFRHVRRSPVVPSSPASLRPR